MTRTHGKGMARRFAVLKFGFCGVIVANVRSLPSLCTIKRKRDVMAVSVKRLLANVVERAATVSTR
jgi:hypothetical protein